MPEAFTRDAGRPRGRRAVVAVAVAGAVLLGVFRLGGATEDAPPEAPIARVLGRVLTVDEVVEIALATQPEIEARFRDYAAARHRVSQALAPLLPQVTARAGASRSLQTTSVTERSVSTIREFDTRTSGPVVESVATSRTSFADTLIAQVSLAQLLFDFGKTLAATEAARKLAAVAQEDVEVQRQLVVLAAREAANNLIFSRRLIAVRRRALERAETYVRVSRRAADAGIRAEADVARAELDLATFGVDMVRATSAEDAARAALNTAMGIRVTVPTQVRDELDDRPVSLDRDRLFGDALRQRPEHRQALLRVEAALALHRQATRSFFPDVSGSYAYGAATSKLDENWTAGLTLSWSLFDGGGRIARLQETEANVEAARARVRASALTVLNDVEQAVVAVDEAQRRIDAARRAMRAAERNFRFIDRRFRTGLGTVLDLADAQAALTDAEAVETQALSDFRLAAYRLDRAVGRR
jgi:outer membrane protein TolC